jgi:hypothetical protein
MARILPMVLFLVVIFPVWAQESITSTDLYGNIDYNSMLSDQTEFMRKFYFQNVDNVDELVNGKDYIPYFSGSKYKPVLYSDRKQRSSLTLRGRRYNNIKLEYDTFRDELIYSDSLKFIDNKVFMISLNRDPIDNFTFYSGSDSLLFRYFSKADDPEFNQGEGFYEVVYEGQSRYIIKHRSYLLVKEGNDEYIYSPADYVKVNEGFTKISNKRSFLKLFGENSDKIKKFIRTNRVHIRKAGKHEITTILKFYDSQIMSDR